MKKKSYIVTALVVALAAGLLARRCTAREYIMPRHRVQVASKAVWSKHFGTSRDDSVNALTSDRQGNLYAVGSTEGALFGNSAGSVDVFAAKYDSDGNRVWAVQFGAQVDDYPSDCALDSNGNLYSGGWTTSNLYATNRGGQDLFLAKLSPSGKVLWGRQLGSEGEEGISSVAVDNQVGIHISGDTSDALFGDLVGSNDLFLAKYDSSGGSLDSGQIGAVDTTTFVSGLALDGQMNRLVCGGTDAMFGPAVEVGTAAFLAKYSPAGSLVWGMRPSVILNSTCAGVASDGAGNVYVVGDFSPDEYPQAVGSGDVFVGKYDSSGVNVWLHTLDSGNTDEMPKIAVGTDGHVYVVGKTFGSMFARSTGTPDTFLAVYSSTGDLLSSKQWVTDSYDWPKDVCVVGQDSIAIGGSYTAANSDYEDAFITVTRSAAVPTFTLSAGTYTDEQKVTITCPTKGVTIRYTTDGSDPTEKSPRYTRPITIDHTLTLKARAWKKDHFPSSTQTAQYTLSAH